MRAFQFTPTYEQFYSKPHERRFLLELDEYEVANLKRLLHAVGGRTGENDLPLHTFNNGDWVGQIGWYLPDVDHRPNRPWPDAE